MVSSKAIKHLPEWFSNNNNKNQQSFHRQSIYIYIYYVQWALMQNNATSAENCAPFAAASFQSIGTCRRPTTFSIPCAMPPCIIAPYFNFNVFCRTAVCEVLSEWMCDACVCADRNSYNTPAAAVFFSFYFSWISLLSLTPSLSTSLSMQNVSIVFVVHWMEIVNCHRFNSLVHHCAHSSTALYRIYTK